MAETNGSGMEGRLSKIERIQEQLQDAMLVHATLEANAAKRIKEHAEWLVRHEQAMDEFDGKLNALIDMMGRAQGGIEQR